MKLTPGERITLIGLLPDKANNTVIRLVHEARMALSFSEEEHKDLKIEEIDLGNGRVFTKWDPGKKDTTKDIELGKVVTDSIVKALRKLNKEESLTGAHISVWDKFNVTEE